MKRIRWVAIAVAALFATPALAGPTFALDEKSFDGMVDKGGILFIDWMAPWCAACKAFGPVYEKVAGRHPDVAFARVDTDQEQSLSHDLRIESIPTLMVVRDGVVVATRIGLVTEPELEALVTRARALDMDKIRAEQAREKAKATDVKDPS